MNPDLVLCADTVHTLTDDDRPIEAIAMHDGVVVATGARRDVREWRGAATEIVDLGAAVLTPGLIDGHLHPVLGLQLTGVDLGAARSLAEVRALLAAAAAECAPGDWVQGWGLDPNVFGERRIDGAAIEAAVGGRPAFVRLFDAHSALATPAALRRAGVDGPRTFAENASVVCDADGRPTGLLLESAAMDLVAEHIPAESVAVRGARLQALLTEMAATGLTGGHVMDFNGDSRAVVAAAEDLADLPLRLRFAPWCVPGIDADGLAELIAVQGRGGRRWRIGGVKFMIDGTIDNGTAWLERPDTFGQSTSSFWPDPAEYTRAVRTFADAGVPTATHAIGDAAVRHVLDSLDGIGHRAAAPHRIEHIETLPSALIGRFRRQRVVASMQPAHCRFTRADHTDNWSVRLGDGRADRAWRCRDLRDAGVPVVLGSDWPIAPFDARHGLATAQLRRPAGAPEIPAVQPDQALTARMALDGYTRLAAAAAGETGIIAVGTRADLTAFAVDPLRADPDELAAAPIVATVVDGRITHRDPAADE
ncbi:amidohydrolase family protein [Nocardia terpenica]|uniref:amidohydrolase n=1 Tax=Nocardia terpenica TaxID=455432 RepID=UPI001893B7CB|nr:amidohydrolase family protein [Nocardia terpenica]MBF6065623.1 amidohydrolase family protein [Nocardia terpenica]MBF6115605.1 amidohydrolase family protein [Nocardia terpenica]MBF6122868.1 amidohydrolase family protein [Nocardia terpenica]MBF6155780.1 amidohydrolase family protein [Nocardia terpenica]